MRAIHYKALELNNKTFFFVLDSSRFVQFTTTTKKRFLYCSSSVCFFFYSYFAPNVKLVLGYCLYHSPVLGDVGNGNATIWLECTLMFKMIFVTQFWFSLDLFPHRML